MVVLACQMDNISTTLQPGVDCVEELPQQILGEIWKNKNLLRCLRINDLKLRMGEAVSKILSPPAKIAGPIEF